MPGIGWLDGKEKNEGIMFWLSPGYVLEPMERLIETDHKTRKR